MNTYKQLQWRWSKATTKKEFIVLEADGTVRYLSNNELEMCNMHAPHGRDGIAVYKKDGTFSVTFGDTPIKSMYYNVLTQTWQQTPINN